MNGKTRRQQAAGQGALVIHGDYLHRFYLFMPNGVGSGDQTGDISAGKAVDWVSSALSPLIVPVAFMPMPNANGFGLCRST